MRHVLSRRTLLGSLAGAAAGASLLGRARGADQKSRPNVLCIAVDDLNTCLGCYGHPLVQSPNVDRLAGRGVRFQGAYCNYPLCNPSRSSLLTGRRPDATGVIVNSDDYRAALPDAVTLPAHFRQNGYYTTHVGKIFHAGFDDPSAWSEGAEKPPAARRPEWTPESLRATFGGDRKMFGPAEQNENEMPDTRTATRAIELLEKHRNESFFIGVGFIKPHVPLLAPQTYFDLYPVEKIQLPDRPPNDRADIPPQALRMNRDLFVDGDPTEQQAKEAIRSYYACVSYMDAQLGRLLDAVDRLALWDSTIVVFFGDNGFHLGEHGFWAKHSLFEEATHCPLIVAAPGKKRGAVARGLVEFVDIYPTLCELAGLPVRPELEGRSFAPLLDNPDAPGKEAVFCQFKEAWGVPGYSVRTPRWRYTEWDGGRAAELYDLEKDPREHHNLVRDPAGLAEIKPVVSRLHALLAANFRAVEMGKGK